MNLDKIKSYLYISLIIGILVSAFSIFSLADSYSSSIEPTSFRSFSVSAEGKVTAIPDVAKFSFSIITEGGKNLTDLQKENTNKTNKAISFLKNNGIDEKDIKTSGYNISPRYQYYNCVGGDYSSPCPPPEIVGYSISQTIEVKVKDFSKIGDIISGVVKNGANNVSSLTFTFDDPEKLELEAKNIAIRKAKEQAKEIAKTAGFSLGKILSLNSQSNETPRPVFYTNSLKIAKDVNEEISAPQIEAGSNEVKVSVTLQYEIK